MLLISIIRFSAVILMGALVCANPGDVDRELGADGQPLSKDTTSDGSDTLDYDKFSQVMKVISAEGHLNDRSSGGNLRATNKQMRDDIDNAALLPKFHAKINDADPIKRNRNQKWLQHNLINKAGRDLIDKAPADWFHGSGDEMQKAFDKTYTDRSYYQPPELNERLKAQSLMSKIDSTQSMQGSKRECISLIPENLWYSLFFFRGYESGDEYMDRSMAFVFKSLYQEGNYEGFACAYHYVRRQHGMKAYQQVDWYKNQFILYAAQRDSGDVRVVTAFEKYKVMLSIGLKGHENLDLFYTQCSDLMKLIVTGQVSDEFAQKALLLTDDILFQSKIIIEYLEEYQLSRRQNYRLALNQHYLNLVFARLESLYGKTLDGRRKYQQEQREQSFYNSYSNSFSYYDKELDIAVANARRQAIVAGLIQDLPSVTVTYDGKTFELAVSSRSLPTIVHVIWKMANSKLSNQHLMFLYKRLVFDQIILDHVATLSELWCKFVNYVKQEILKNPGKNTKAELAQMDEHLLGLTLSSQSEQSFQMLFPDLSQDYDVLRAAQSGQTPQIKHKLSKFAAGVLLNMAVENDNIKLAGQLIKQQQSISASVLNSQALRAKSEDMLKILMSAGAALNGRRPHNVDMYAMWRSGRFQITQNEYPALLEEYSKRPDVDIADGDALLSEDWENKQSSLSYALYTIVDSYSQLTQAQVQKALKLIQAGAGDGEDDVQISSKILNTRNEILMDAYFSLHPDKLPRLLEMTLQQCVVDLVKSIINFKGGQLITIEEMKLTLQQVTGSDQCPEGKSVIKKEIMKRRVQGAKASINQFSSRVKFGAKKVFGKQSNKKGNAYEKLE
ncbi:hypothetical protein MP228_010430 [Amoeboaphelidium protococcarum]|nr:hypothetical protein MP228_010430 [Amoeboaphelidium protococcarum]